jgi:hypothetical protein
MSAELHLIHALSLVNRPLRAVMPALNNLSAVMQEAEVAMRAQVRRLVPYLGPIAEPVVDLDGGMRVVAQWTRRLGPMAVITPPIWEWDSTGRQRGALSAGAIERLGTPLFILREARRETVGRVIIVTQEDQLHAGIVEAAGRWGFLLEMSYGNMGAAGCGPELDVVMTDAPVPDDRADLIVLDGNAFTQPEYAHHIDRVMPVLLARSRAPIVYMPAVRHREEQDARNNSRSVEPQGAA